MFGIFHEFFVRATNPYSYSPVDKSKHPTPMAPKPSLNRDKVKNLLEASVIQTRIALEEPSWSKASGKSYAIALDAAAAPAIQLLNEAAAEISLYRDNSLFEKFRETVDLIREELDKVKKNDWSEKVQKKALDDCITWEFRRGVGAKIWMEAIGARMRCDPRKEPSKFFLNPDSKIKEHEA